LAQGEPIRQGYEVQGAKIIDLAPTLLHLLGVPAPDDMDGRVLQDILTEEFNREFEVQTTAASGLAAVTHGSGEYTGEDEKTIEDRLRSLGYVD
jgi:arylsulfatase A-like enzyme